MDGDLQEMNTDQSSVENEKSSETPKEEVVKELTVSDLIDIEKDFSTCDKETLISDFKKLLKYPNISEIRAYVEAIEKAFTALKIVENQQLKDAFIASGEKEEDFKPPFDILESNFKELIHQYHEKRKRQREQRDVQQKENWAIKDGIIQEIKDMLEGKGSMRTYYERVRELQSLWSKTGSVAADKYKEQNERYHFALDQFFDLLRVNRELIEIDQKKNEKLKIELCEEVERMADVEDIVEAFKELQLLHDRWKEIGFVKSEIKQPLWDRFSAATSVVNNRYHTYQGERKAIQAKDVARKQQLTDRITEIMSDTYEKYKDISAFTDEVVALQKEWKGLGIYYIKEDRKLSETFRNACNMFFAQKRKLQKDLKRQYQDVIDRKEAICSEAESLLNSDDVEGTTARLIELQRDWKKVGNVPPRMSEPIWQRFKTACDAFFDRKKGIHKEAAAEEKLHLESKKALIETIKSFEPVASLEDNRDAIRDFIRQWDEIGLVPRSKTSDVNHHYRLALDEALSKIDMDQEEKVLFRFNIRLDSLMKSDDKLFLLNKERNHILSKMEKLHNELRTTKNNLGFLSSSADSPLMKEVNERLGNLQKQLTELSTQLQRVKELMKE
ncbi:DUF349 domain-containing protein [Halosquirtibacter xylanolyticus]|uniref:DUF349 domain-containing protein n=1 Tax=Halosquirtibacter xylanolyticus TaxID=3374599 RepID=UPI003749AF16|nr:DUF349 domain-containing protein [Prolixibacteraceae bacterium]